MSARKISPRDSPFARHAKARNPRPRGVGAAGPGALSDRFGRKGPLSPRSLAKKFSRHPAVVSHVRPAGLVAGKCLLTYT